MVAGRCSGEMPVLRFANAGESAVGADSPVFRPLVIYCINHKAASGTALKSTTAILKAAIPP